MAKPYIVACINLKGGVGKTAIAVNFAAYCGQIKKLRTLLVDLDPQTNATFSCISVDDWEATPPPMELLLTCLELALTLRQRESSATSRA